MNTLLSYIRYFFHSVDKWFLLFCLSFGAVLITLNYRFGIETRWLYPIHSRFGKFFGFFSLYAIAFIIPYLVLLYFKHREVAVSRVFWVLLICAPVIFAAKVSFQGLVDLHSSGLDDTWGKYYNIITNLPSRLIVVLIPLIIFWWLENNTKSFWGLTTRNLQFRPYLLLLLMMVPLIAFASTQRDFLDIYPKMKQVAFLQDHTDHSWFYKGLFETAYGIDFVTIELFFRGFLVFAFVRYVGADAILPMAVFYCSIHFGKPLFECMSSFFGGMMLGIIAYRTKSIVGGLVVHLGIAWLMEVGAILGNSYKN